MHFCRWLPRAKRNGSSGLLIQFQLYFVLVHWLYIKCTEVQRSIEKLVQSKTFYILFSPP